MAAGRYETITISLLEKHYHLPKGYLDRRCTNEHALQIASQLNTWERLASRLGLTQQHIEAIKRDYDGEEGRREATLRKWKQVFSFGASYRKLIEAFLAIERADLASDICELIAPQKEQPPSLPQAPQRLQTTQQDHLSVDQSPSPSPSSPQTSLGPTSPQSSSGISVGSPPLQLTFAISQHITKWPTAEKVEIKFSKVVEKIEELFQENRVPLEKLQRIASHLPADLKGEFGRLFEKKISRIFRTKTITELFAILSYFWDYLQPDLLVYIVERIGVKEAQVEMSGYEHELSTFRREVKLEKYLGTRRHHLDDEDYYKIEIRLGNEWHEKTLDDLEKMRFAFADEFSLLRLVPKLHGLKSGSITVIFSLPKSVVLNHDQLLKFFQPYNPLQVMVDGVSIYDVESHESKDTQSDTVENMEGESRGTMTEEKQKVKQQFHPVASSDTKRKVTDWEETIQKRKRHFELGSIDVLIIVSSESLQGPDIVPRRDVELTKEDIEKLQRLNLPPEQWKDDASIMKARYEMSSRYTVVGVERSTPEDGLTREYVLKRIERLMTSTRKQGVAIYYCGPGKKNTGDWCFEDGYITFRDLAQLYCNFFKGGLVVIGSDCSFSGSWVKELMKFLDEQGIQPCGHSAREKGILIKLGTSCQSTEIPYRLLYSVRASMNDKNTGMLSLKCTGFKVTEGQHVYFIDTTELTCITLSFKETCTWEREVARDRIILLRGVVGDGQPYWWYITLVDDEAKISEFKQVTRGDNTERLPVGMMYINKYGKDIVQGWGNDPPEEINTWIRKN